MKRLNCFLFFAFLVGSLVSCSQPFLSQIEGERAKTPTFRVMWNKNLDPPYETGNFPISFSAPFIHEGLLFMGSPTGKMSAYHLQNGRNVWSARERTGITGQSGIYKDQVLYGTLEGRVISRNYLNGKLKYKVDLGEAIDTQPVFYQERVLVHLRNHKVVCLDAATGKILWTYSRNVSQSPTLHGASRPFPFQQKILVGFADGFLGALSLEEGVLLWEQKLSNASKFVDVDTSPVIFENILYSSSFSGNLNLLRPDSGNVLYTLPFSPSRAPLLSLEKDALFIGTVKGTVHRLNVQNNEVLAEKNLGMDDAGITSMNLWKDMLVVATTKGKIFFLDPKTLDIRDEFSLGGKFSTVFGALEVREDRLAFASSRNRLYVLE